MPASSNNNEPLFPDLAGRTARLMLYGLLAITLMAMDHRGRYVDAVRQWFGQAVQPIYRLVDLPPTLASAAGEYFGSRKELNRRLASLEKEYLLAEARLLQLAELAADNAELRSIIEASRRLEGDYLPAELLRVDLNPFSHRVVIDKGRRHGVRQGMPVIDAGGVLGQVDMVYHATSTVVLISDPDHALPVSIFRTGQRTIAYGTGDAGLLMLPDIPMTADLEPGDIILTSGLDEHFPAGLPVAEIESVRRPRGNAFASAGARPLGQLDRSRHVLLVMLPEAPEETVESVETAP